MSYASAGVGSPHHLAAEMLRERTGMKMQHVAYRGAAPAVQDLIGGQVPFGMIDTASVQQYVASGKLRAVGVASATRLPTLPEVPTFAEQGVPGFAAYAWQGLVVPAATPRRPWPYSQGIAGSAGVRTGQGTLPGAGARRHAGHAGADGKPIPAANASAGASWCSRPASSWIEAGWTAGMQIDATHDPALQSWVPSANQEGTDFPIQNLPFGRFRRAGSQEALRIGVAIGDQVLDLRSANEQERWSAEVAGALAPLAAGDLNTFMAAGSATRRAVRAALSQALAQGSPQQQALASCLVPQAGVELTVPCAIGDYTDFYTGIHHATTVGKPVPARQPAAAQLPVGADRLSRPQPRPSWRAATRCSRPLGQTKAADAQQPSFGPSQRLDYELELGFLIGPGNPLGRADRHRRARRSTCSA